MGAARSRQQRFVAKKFCSPPEALVSLSFGSVFPFPSENRPQMFFRRTKFLFSGSADVVIDCTAGYIRQREYDDSVF